MTCIEKMNYLKSLIPELPEMRTRYNNLKAEYNDFLDSFDYKKANETYSEMVKLNNLIADVMAWM